MTSLLVAALLAVSAPPAADAAYALDGLSREVPTTGRVSCPDVELTRYEGEVLRYHKATRVYVGFAERLRRFEEVARDVAVEVYGRAPRRVVHLGTYHCRRIGGYPNLISEHGLGNGIDVAGFDFPALPRAAALPEGLPRTLRKAFQVRMKDHWTGDRGAGAVHARFLHTLAQRLIARDDVFRVLLGPAWPGHHDHFHFDMAPYRLVAVFEER